MISGNTFELFLNTVIAIDVFVVIYVCIDSLKCMKYLCRTPDTWVRYGMCLASLVGHSLKKHI